MELVPFDDRDGWIWWDGALMPWRDAKLHVLTHGLHYASAVFEGERAYAGNIFRLRDHTDRRVIPSRKQSGSGVCSSPSITKKTFALVVSATLPRQSSISASAQPRCSARCFANVPII